MGLGAETRTQITRAYTRSLPGICSVSDPWVTWRLHVLGIQQALPCFCPPLGDPPFPRWKLVHHRSCPRCMDHMATLSCEGGSHVWSLARRAQIKIPSFARRGGGAPGEHLSVLAMMSVGLSSGAA